MTDVRDSTLTAHVVWQGQPARRTRDSVLGAHVVYQGPRAHRARNSELAASVVYALAPFNTPRNSVLGAHVVWAPGLAGAARTRAWTFVLDGHTFYVLDLGGEGTFVYDLDTEQWSQWQTAGGVGWNVRAGVMWTSNNRIVGGDSVHPTLWEVDPDTTTDEGFRSIEHKASGLISTRSRVFLAVEELRIAGSLGRLSGGDVATTMTLRYSDDNGQTWTTTDPVTLTPGLTSGDFGEVVWRSIGSFMAPGRLFELSDVGGMLRIDGADVFIEDFDNDGEISSGG